VHFATKQKTHQVGFASALGLRAGEMSRPCIADHRLARVLDRLFWSFNGETLMNALLRTAVVGFVVGLLTVAVVTLRWTYSASDAQEQRRVEELDRLREATLHREEARRQAVQEWIAQRRSLAETMQRFQDLDHDWPDYHAAWLREKLPESEAERQYRQIVNYVKTVLQGRAEELAAVLCRLENEYRQLQAGK
jgi:hypothetical protein